MFLWFKFEHRMLVMGCELFFHAFKEKNYNFESTSFELVDSWMKLRASMILIWFSENVRFFPPTILTHSEGDYF